jgi:TonB family protein
MKSLSLLVLSLLCSVSVAFSQKIYQSFEVTTPAEPTGGAPLLNQFISSNLQVPVQTMLKGKSAAVYVKGVVELDGTLGEITILKPGDALNDSEAIRVVKLYKAWKPAVVEGEKVRQSVHVPVVFKSEPLKNYDPTEKVINDYFDKTWKPTEDEASYHFKVSTPLDDFGFINGPVVYKEKSKKGWDEKHSIELKKEEIWYKLWEAGAPDSVQAIQTTLEDKKLNTTLLKMTRQLDGKLLAYSQFTSLGKPIVSKRFHFNGAIKSIRYINSESESETQWYPNGQLLSMIEFPAQSNPAGKMLIAEFWDEKGNRMIDRGNGTGKLIFESYKNEPLFEEGQVKDGLKTGVWTGKLKDGTILFEENFEQGEIINGISYMDGQKIAYSKSYINAEFNGGLPGMYQFLSKNMKYPKDAAKEGVSGKVFVSFTVCEDGTLCDYEVIKPLYESMDEEALRVVKEMSGKWQPGWKRGKKVRVKYNLPISFQLE